MIQEPTPSRKPPGVTPGDTESSRANRGWWDRNADEYQIEHGTFLGDDRFVWGPEGLDEVEAELLGPPEDLKGEDVLEIGAGAAQCSRWLAAQGARPVALDLSHRQLQHALRIGRRDGAPLVEADAGALPFARRLLRPGVLGVRRAAVRRRPGAGAPRGAPGAAARRPLRLLGDAPDPLGVPRRAGPRGPVGRRPPTSTARRTSSRTRRAARCTSSTTGRSATGCGTWWPAGFRLVDLVEPEWPAWNTQEWGGWSPLRGNLIPGTAIFVCERTTETAGDRAAGTRAGGDAVRRTRLGA